MMTRDMGPLLLTLYKSWHTRNRIYSSVKYLAVKLLKIFVLYSLEETGNIFSTTNNLKVLDDHLTLTFCTRKKHFVP